MATEPSNPINRFLEVLGGLLVITGGQPIVTAMMGGSLRDIWAAVPVCIIGLLLLWAGVFWHPKPDSEDRFVKTLGLLASDARSYVAMVLLAWLYMATVSVIHQVQHNNEIVSLRNDEQSITNMLDRFVLPRQLSPGQINSISSFLQNFPPQEVAYVVAQGDEEAGSYRADIQRALEKGGWHTKSINYVQDPPQIGLSINLMQTMEHAQAQHDFTHPNAELVLQEAFGLAGVRLDSSGGGSGINVTEDLMTIVIGHRRRDSYALPIPPNSN